VHCASDSTISGGYNNTISCTNVFDSTIRSVIGGGQYNTIATGYVSFIGGGTFNTLGTPNNVASGDASVISGGDSNVNFGYKSVVSGGFVNKILGGNFNGIFGGECNNVNQNNNCTHIIGSNITSNRSCATFVNNLSIMNVPTSASGLPTGAVWRDPATNGLFIVP